MLEKAQSRQQRAAFDFESQYENLCYLSDIAPLRSVKASVAEGVVDINGDLLRSHDWPPLLDALKTNKSLSSVVIRSGARSEGTPSSGKENDSPTSGSASTTTFGAERLPPLRTRDITYRLCLSLKDCLSVSPALTNLTLRGVPLRERDVVALAKGLRDNNSLVALSLEGCQIADKGAEMICDNVKKLRKLKTVNLASCGLSASGAEALSLLIRHQSIRRHDDAWKDSLRYRRPELDVMAGIRRVTLNGNGLIGDEGVRILAETLKDDLWIKALDMQRCGVTTKGAAVVLDVMKYNTSIVVLDLRRNPAVDNNVLRNVMEHVLINANGKEQEFQWLSTAGDAAAAATTTTASSRSGSGKRSDSRSRHRAAAAGGGGGGGGDKRSGAFSSRGAPCRTMEGAEVPHGPAIPPHHVDSGVPHFTAERALRHGCSARTHPHHHQQQHQHHHHHRDPSAGDGRRNQHQHQHPLSYPREDVVGISVNGGDDHSTVGRDSSPPPPPPPEFSGGGGAAPRSVQFAGHRSESSCSDASRDGGGVGGVLPPTKPPRVGWTGEPASASSGDASEAVDEVASSSAAAIVTTTTTSSAAVEMKKLRVDFEQCWRHLQEESKARRQAEERIVELTLENSKLQQSVEELEERANSVLDDDAILDSIETTFTKFHSFLDLLKEVGLGQLISYAGIEIPPPVTPNQSIDQSATEGAGGGGAGGDSSIFAAPTPLKKHQLNISESTRNFMSEQVSRILQESVMKQTPAARMQHQQRQPLQQKQPPDQQQQQQRPDATVQPIVDALPKRRLESSFSPPPPALDAADESMDLPGYNYREKMMKSALNRHPYAVDGASFADHDVDHEESVLRGFNPIVTSSRVWNNQSHVNHHHSHADADATVSDLVRGDPFLGPARQRLYPHHSASSRVGGVGGASANGVEFTPEEDDVYARLLRRARDTTGYPYDDAGIADFSAENAAGDLAPPPLLPDWSGFGGEGDRSLLPPHLVVAAPAGFDDTMPVGAAAAVGVPPGFDDGARHFKTGADKTEGGNLTVTSGARDDATEALSDGPNAAVAASPVASAVSVANDDASPAKTRRSASPEEIGSRQGSGSDEDSFGNKPAETTVLSMPELEEYKMEGRLQKRAAEGKTGREEEEELRQQQQQQSEQQQQQSEQRRPLPVSSPLEGISPDLEEFRGFEDLDSDASSLPGGAAPTLTPPATPPPPRTSGPSPPGFPDDESAAVPGVDSPAPQLNSVLTSAKEALRKTSKLQELIEENRVVEGFARGSSNGGSSGDDATEVPSFASDEAAGAAADAEKRSSESARSVASEDEISEASGGGGGEGGGGKTSESLTSVDQKSNSSGVDLEDILSDPDFNENFPNF